MSIEREADLYPVVKAHLEGMGYVVRGEVGRCDAVGFDGRVLIAVELKLAFGLTVIHQALDRLSAVDLVYVAVAVPSGRRARARWDRQLPDALRLCRMLGLGLLSVRDGRLVVHGDPAPYQPRKRPEARARLLGEFCRRSGDHNVGGTTRRPRVTAYREEALAAHGPMAPARLRDLLGLPSAAAKLQDNVYGWFARVRRGVYALAPAGADALALYADVLAARRAQAAALPRAHDLPGGRGLPRPRGGARLMPSAGP